MNARRRLHSRRACTVAAVCVLVLVPGVHAEVGVHDLTPTGSEMPVPYILGIITDEGNPIEPLFWSEVRAPSPSYRVLNPEGDAAGDGRPDLVLHPTTRQPIVAWARHAPTGFDVVVSRYADGAWTVPDVVVDVSEDALDPRLAIDPATGEVNLVYWIDGAVPRVEWRVAPADLSIWSEPEVVSGPQEQAARPQATFDQGTLRVAYEVDLAAQGGAPRQVVLARRDAGSFVPEIVATTQHDGPVRPEVHAHGGRLWIDWIDSGEAVAWTRWDPLASSWEVIRTEPYVDLEDLEYHVRGAVRAKALQ
jgi:hypothetical protein